MVDGEFPTFDGGDVLTFYDYEIEAQTTATVESIDPIDEITRYINVIKHGDEYTDEDKKDFYPLNYILWHRGDQKKSNGQIFLNDCYQKRTDAEINSLTRYESDVELSKRKRNASDGDERINSVDEASDGDERSNSVDEATDVDERNNNNNNVVLHTTWWFELVEGRRNPVRKTEIAQARVHDEFAVESCGVEDERWSRIILRKIRKDKWEILDETGTEVLTTAVDTADAGPIVEWGRTYRQPSFTNIEKYKLYALKLRNEEENANMEIHVSPRRQESRKRAFDSQKKQARSMQKKKQ